MQAVRELVERALEAAAPRLRSGLDRQAASMRLVALLVVPVTWQAHCWLEPFNPERHAARSNDGLRLEFHQPVQLPS
jgi:hypothetical protein